MARPKSPVTPVVTITFDFDILAPIKDSGQNNFPIYIPHPNPLPEGEGQNAEIIFDEILSESSYPNPINARS